MNIREAIQQMTKDPVSFKGMRLGTVVSIDDVARTCVVNVLDSETDIPGVRLHVSGISENGAYYKPAIDSLVGIMPLFSFEYAVVLYSKISEIVFLDGSFGGIVKVEDLTTKLNNLENKVNAIITWGATVSPPLTTPPLVTTNQAEIENPLITHGTV